MIILIARLPRAIFFCDLGAMTSSQQFSYALSKWGASWSFIFRNKLGHFFIYPIVLTIALNIIAFSGIQRIADYLMVWVKQWVGVPQGELFDSFTDFFQHVASNLTLALIWILGIIVFYKISKYVSMAIMSPVMSILSSKTEEIITGKSSPFDFGQFLKDIVRGVALSVRNLFMELFFTGAIFFVNIIVGFIFPPAEIVLTPLSAIVSLAIGAFYSGFGTIDYALENRRYTFHQSIQFMRKNKGLAVGNGLMYSLLFRIPFIGVAIATVTSTVSGTIIVCEERYLKSSGE